MPTLSKSTYGFAGIALEHHNEGDEDTIADHDLEPPAPDTVTSSIHPDNTEISGRPSDTQYRAEINQSASIDAVLYPIASNPGKSSTIEAQHTTHHYRLLLVSAPNGDMKYS
ncbi:unnamed protein product [Rhizoctonia solani]|uniref:Uncharacterized protein n=1 Tax=Rhizoctonia solani TaxID=456999 RepID=A0A8H3CU06_9AGAM|nr:unnamed protein product [Rhizoctonia solani]